MQLLYFELNMHMISFYILYFKIKNSNMYLVNTVEKDKNIENVFGCTIFMNSFY